MAYCTVDDLNDYAARLDIDEYSDPTATEVEGMIDSITVAMDQKFNAVGITVPITDATLLEFVRPICVHGSLAKYYRSVEMESAQAAILQKLYDDAMKEIMRTPAILQTGSVSVGTPLGITRASDPPFERETKAW